MSGQDHTVSGRSFAFKQLDTIFLVDETVEGLATEQADMQSPNQGQWLSR